MGVYCPKCSKKTGIYDKETCRAVTYYLAPSDHNYYKNAVDPSAYPSRLPDGPSEKTLRHLKPLDPFMVSLVLNPYGSHPYGQIQVDQLYYLTGTGNGYDITDPSLYVVKTPQQLIIQALTSASENEEARHF